MPAGFAPLPLLVDWCNAATVFGTNPCLLGRSDGRIDTAALLLAASENLANPCSRPVRRPLRSAGAVACILGWLLDRQAMQQNRAARRSLLIRNANSYADRRGNGCPSAGAVDQTAGAGAMQQFAQVAALEIPTESPRVGQPPRSGLQRCPASTPSRLCSSSTGPAPLCASDGCRHSATRAAWASQLHAAVDAREGVAVQIPLIESFFPAGSRSMARGSVEHIPGRFATPHVPPKVGSRLRQRHAASQSQACMGAGLHRHDGARGVAADSPAFGESRVSEGRLSTGRRPVPVPLRLRRLLDARSDSGLVRILWCVRR